MWRKFFICLLVFAGTLSAALAQSAGSLAKLNLTPSYLISSDNPAPVSNLQRARIRALSATKRVNVFILSRERNFNLTSAVFRFEASLRRIFNKNIVLIKANSLEEMGIKTDRYMLEHPDEMIGHLWIDSHGRYKKGYSFFSVGVDTLNAFNLRAMDIRGHLEKLTAFCDEQTAITIGSCYGAADFLRPGNDILTPSYMAGDSLLLQMGEIFQISPVYGCPSWVMAKPLSFGRRWGISGYPIERKYMDEIFRPVWERLGQWKRVPAGEQRIEDVPTPFLTPTGALQMDGRSYQSLSRNKRRMEKKLKHLKPGMYRLGRK
jgi:hypothetical protein